MSSSSFSFMLQLLKLIICLAAVVQASAQPSSSNQNQNDDDMYNPKFSPSMGIIIIVLISSLFLMGFFSIYIRNCAGGGDYSTTAAGGARAGGSRRSRRGPARGLDPAVIQSFPTFQYSSVRTLHLGKGALECAVCLNEFEDDNETLRLIPNCDHVFHPECIDAWLSAHTTCPVCRADLCNVNPLNPHADPLELELELEGESVHAPLHQISEHVIDVDVDVDVDVDAHAHVIEPTQQQSQGQQQDAKVSEVVSASISGKKKDDQIQKPITNPIILNRNPTTRSSSRTNNSNIISRSRSMSTSVRPPRWLRMFNRSNSTGHLPIRHWDPTDMDRFTLRVPDQVRKQIMMMNRTTSCLALQRGEREEREGGEGSSRRGPPANGSGRWVFSLAPPFFSRVPSVRVAAAADTDTAGSTSGSIPGSVKGSLHLSRRLT